MAPVLLKKYWLGDPPLEKIIEGWEALDRLKGSSLPEEVQETRTQLREMIQSFSRMLADGPDPQALARVIDQSGLNLENKLRRLITPDGKPSRPAVPEEDLKGLFLKMKSQLERDGAGNGAGTPADHPEDGALSIIECRGRRPC